VVQPAPVARSSLRAVLDATLAELPARLREPEQGSAACRAVAELYDRELAERFGTRDAFVSIAVAGPQPIHAEALTAIRQWCEAEGLQLHPTKTKIVDIRVAGFDFLGYHFQTTRRGRLTRWPRKKSMQKLKEAIRAKTKRTDGRALQCIIADINRTLRGWFGYFQHSYHTTFAYVDRWVRGRLRSILRKRAGHTGRGRGVDHQRWPNAFFAGHGYFSLEAAFAAARQPPCG
jgi:hypothetical protein